MPIFQQLPITNAYVKVRYKEPYVSDALNKKTFGVFPKGIYAGFSLSPGNLSTRDILVGSTYVPGGLGSGFVSGYSSGAYDETIGFSVAVFQSTEGVNTTVQIPPPNNSYHLDATGLEGQRVYAVINVSYVVGQTTTLHLMLVDSAMLDQDPSLVVIGHVDVPASPSTPLDSSMFGYDDPQYPRLTPLSTPVRAGLMPKETWGQIAEIHELTDLAIVKAKDPVDVSVDVTAATGELLDGTKIRLPIGTQVVEYAGGTINFETGVVTGGGDNFTGAATLLSNGQEVYYSVQILKGNPNTLLILPGTPATIGSGAYAPFADGTIPRAQVLVKKTGGFVQDISQSDVTLILSSGSGSGAGAGGSDLIRAVWEDEKGVYSVPQPNQFLDNFSDDSKGTYVNCGVSGGLLKPSGVNTSYSYERTKETTSTCVSAEGVSFMSIIALAPNNTAITSDTIKFNGDVTPYLAATKPVTILREFENDGQIDHVHLTQPNPTLVAKLTISSISFSAGVTTMVLSNPKNLDLTMGVSPGNQNAELRVCPADYQLQASVTGTYQDMSLVDAHIINVVRIPAASEGYSTLPGSISGSIEWSDMQISDNKDYAIITAVEKTAGNSTWHFWYSTNGGVNFTKFATTQTVGATTTDEFAGQYNRVSRMQIRVADNGKSVFAYTTQNGSSRRSVYAMYSDLSAGSPALSDFPAIGSSDALNDDPLTAGGQFSLAASDTEAVMEIDASDASMVCFGGGVSGSALYVRFWTWTGATPSHDGLSNATVASLPMNQSHWSIEISGSTPNHRATLFLMNASGFLKAHYWDEGSTTEVGNNTLTSTVDGRMLDTRSLGDKVYIAIHENGAPWTGELTFVVGDLSTQIYSSERFFDAAIFDILDTRKGFGGTVSDLGQTCGRLFKQKILIDPANSDHVLFVVDTYHASTNLQRAMIYEVIDSSNFLGSFISVTQNSSLNFRETSSDQQYAQIITGTAGQHINTWKILLRQVGTLASNATVYAEIQGVSAGAPDGVVLATSQSIDASKISKNSAGVFEYFNFPQYTLASQQYALVLKTTNIATSATNYLVIGTNSSAPYAGGNLLSYNGSSWTDTTHDISMELNGCYIYVVGEGIDETTNSMGPWAFQDQESTISLINSSTAQILYRKSATEASGTRSQTSGHTKRKVLTISSGTNQSVLSSATVVGYASADLDENLILNVSFGESACEGKSVTTGLGDGIKGYDRSGLTLGSSHSTTSGDYISDPDFESGFCLENPGTTTGFAYSITASADSQIGNFLDNSPFAIEAEYKPAGLSSVNYIVVKHSAGNPNGWLLTLETTGALRFASGSGGATESNETFSAGVYQKFLVTGSGGVVRLYYWNGSSYTECTYSVQDTSYSFTSNAYPITVGTVPGGSNPALGRFGRVKIAVGASTFVYEGFKDQSSLGSARNLGTKVLAERRIGHPDNTIGASTSNFDELVLIDPTANEQALVDSYDQLWLWTTQFNTGGSTLKTKLLGNRASSSDPSGLPALGCQFFNG